MKGVTAIVGLWLLAAGWANSAAFATDQPTAFITGSNRGLGLEFARQYAARNWNVIATCRDPEHATELKALARERGNVAASRQKKIIGLGGGMALRGTGRQTSSRW